MRRLPPKGDPPESLTNASATAALNRAKEAVGKGKAPTFAGYVYGAEDVRATLNQLQNGNCAYCEARIAPTGIGDIEHFRPKGEVLNEETGLILRPGYYWLAYEWNNLLLACQQCNQRYKGSRFPVAVEALRARSPPQSLPAEKHVLLNPFLDEPGAHIEFKAELPVAKNGSIRGAVTIEVLGLDREPLNTARARKLQLLAALMAVEQLGLDEAADAVAELHRMKAQDAEFASCISAFLDGPN